MPGNKYLMNLFLLMSLLLLLSLKMKKLWKSREVEGSCKMLMREKNVNLNPHQCLIKQLCTHTKENYCWGFSSKLLKVTEKPQNLEY